MQESAAIGQGHGLLRGGTELLQHGAYVGGVQAPRIRQHHALAHPGEQGLTELCLQLAHLARDGALREVQLLRRT